MIRGLLLAALCAAAAIFLVATRDRHPPPWTIGHSLVLAAPAAPLNEAGGLFYARSAHETPRH